MTVSLFADSKFTVVTLFFVSHAVKIFITCTPLVDFRRSKNVQRIQKLRNLMQTYTISTDKKDTTCTYITGPDGGSKKSTKLRKIHLLTLLFVRIGKNRPLFRIL
jgi:hypothetical protein